MKNRWDLMNWRQRRRDRIVSRYWLLSTNWSQPLRRITDAVIGRCSCLIAGHERGRSSSCGWCGKNLDL